MTDSLASTLLKVLLPAVGIAALLFAAKRNRMSLTEDIGFRKPVWIPAAAFLVLWLVLIAVEEWATAAMGSVENKVWPDYPALIVVLRILAIGVVGPIAEELAFRGLLMAWLGRTRLGVYGAIAVSAAVWSVVHIQYAPLLLTIIFIDGLALGLARHYSRSLYVPIAMHVIGNLFSIWQSIAR